MTMTSRSLPRQPEPDSAAFWAATTAHELRYQQCRRCRRVVFFVRVICPGCGSDNLESKLSRGAGAVYSRTVVRRDGQPFFRERTPYVYALVDLDEGFRVASEIVTSDVDRVAISDRVQVTWEDHPDVSIPLFTPASQPARAQGEG
jgi:uncharacterized OB-fold protein